MAYRATKQATARQDISDDSVIRLKPYHYIHVQDNNANTSRVIVGPQTFTRQDHEKSLTAPEPMICIPPRSYCVISNPVVCDAEGAPVIDEFGQAKLRYGEQEIRFEQDPFPLFPGEVLEGSVETLQVVPPNTGIKLRALRDFESGDVTRIAGDEWLFVGPGTYMPCVDEEIVEVVSASIIKPGHALKLRAKRAFADQGGTARKAGEEWLVRNVGAYLPEVDVEIVDSISPQILTPKIAVHMRATRTFTDVFKKERKAGEEWLVTSDMTESYIPDVYEVVVEVCNVITLTSRQYCVIVDPCDSNGKPQLGVREVRKGERTFFLQPGERLEHGKLQAVHVLGEDEALLLKCAESFQDTVEGKAVERSPGDRWMIKGPLDYVPPVEVEILEKRCSIPLDDTEGIYVRDINSGKVRAISGQSYMLTSTEELWAKDLPANVESMLASENKSSTKRDKTRLVTMRAPHNTAVQIYDYKEKQARVVFGPDLVMLGPDEHFTALSISGGKPKVPGAIQAIALFLGPDFMTDIITVETSDHARLQLQLSYNWFFDVDKSSESDAAKIFQIPDFVGDTCKAIASRVRGAVAGVAFDHFHKNSAAIIRQAVFGVDNTTGAPKEKFYFPANKLVISNIDIQAVEPVDQKTRQSLMKSVQLAIGITTQSQEAKARHEAERVEQEARGKLERQKISDEAKAEQARKQLLLLQSESAAVESSGTAKAEAQARAEAAAIEGQTAVIQAKLRAQANKIETESELSQLKSNQTAEIDHQRALDALEVTRAKELGSIESKKFKETVTAIGPETISAIAAAGPATQAKLLSGLGIKSMLITDGNSPINLFNTASGLMGGGGGGLPALPQAK